MADHIGIVIKQSSDRYAQVLTDRKGACGGCHASPGGCRSCLSGAKMESRVANPLGAQPGDLVKVHLSSGNLYAGAAILYLIPILGLLAGAFMGAAVGPFGAIGGAAAGLVIGFTAVIVLDRTAVIRRRITPTITDILTPNVDVPDKAPPFCSSHG